MINKLHLGMGHYGIGFQDGVNTVISRNVRALREIDPDLKITLFGRLAPDYQDFLDPVPGSLEYLNIDEFSPEGALRKKVEKSIAEQQVHDYVWQGTNLAEILDQKLRDMDVILTGYVFIFRNSRKTAIKILRYDGQGYWICQKKLSKGRFQRWPDKSGGSIKTLDAHELQMLIWNGNPSATGVAPMWRRVAA